MKYLEQNRLAIAVFLLLVLCAIANSGDIVSIGNSNCCLLELTNILFQKQEMFQNTYQGD